jgi:hypothetical protein
MDPDGLYTLGTVVVDYRGYRITAQSIIPGEFISHFYFIVWGSLFSEWSYLFTLFIHKVLSSSKQK